MLAPVLTPLVRADRPGPGGERGDGEGGVGELDTVPLVRPVSTVILSVTPGGCRDTTSAPGTSQFSSLTLTVSLVLPRDTVHHSVTFRGERQAGAVTAAQLVLRATRKTAIKIKCVCNI